MCDVLDYISDEKIKTTRDQVTTHSNIPVSNFLLLNSVDSLKAGSQYSVRVASRPEVIIFSMGLDAARRRNRIRFYSCVVLRPSPLKK